jgi:hypothetical protein
MAFVLSTLHIFGYGETQVIGNDGTTSVNKKVPTSVLTKVTPVVDDVYSFKPTDNLSPNEYHAINIFNDMFADYQPKGDFESWRTEWSKLNKTAIDELVAEVLAYTPPTQP